MSVGWLGSISSVAAGLSVNACYGEIKISSRVRLKFLTGRCLTKRILIYLELNIPR